MFKALYNRAKTVEVDKEQMKNSAMGSISGFSKILEERRQKAKLRKQQKEEGKDKGTAEQKMKSGEETQKMAGD